MPNWLTKTFQTIKQVTESEPVPFEITCYCGKYCEGERNQDSRIVQCYECGERIFVLPLNVYPAPKQQTSQKRDVEKKSDSLPAKKNSSGKEASKKTQPIAQQNTTEAVEITEFIDDEPELETISIPRKRWLRPFHYVLICIGSVLLMTSWWLIHSYRQDQAIETLRTSVEAGETALEENNLIIAEQEFGKAAKATLILNRNDNDSRRVRQLFKELQSINQLSSSSLFELISELESKYDQKNPESWKEYFQSHYANQWVIIEARVDRENGISYSLLLDDADLVLKEKKKDAENKKPRPVNNSEMEADPAVNPDNEIQPIIEEEPDEEPTSKRYVIHYPIEIDQIPLVLNVDIATLHKLPFTDSSETILFAGQLRQCELLDLPQPVWVIDFVPEKTFLWSNEKLLTAIGYPIDNPAEKERIQKILKRQTNLLEEKE